MFYFSICVLSLFALIGVLQVCRGIAQALTRSKNDSEIILIEPIRKKQEDAELLLRSAAGKVMWMGRFAPDRVVCLDCDMDSETKRVCRLVCDEYPFMELCTKSEILERIERMTAK
ncbi:MAG: hypothetical protein IIU14_01370 [Ruminococcus sp.]|nr:hypothetical protein [Ruminococcus sp.]